MVHRVDILRAKPRLLIHAASALLSRELDKHNVHAVFQDDKGDHLEVRVVLDENDALTKEEIGRALEKIGFTLIAEIAQATSSLSQ